MELNKDYVVKLKVLKMEGSWDIYPLDAKRCAQGISNMVMDNNGRAAKDGNTMELQTLLEKDPLILERGSFAAEEETESALHIAAMLGHVEFVRELIKHKSNNVGDIDPHGFSPLHLASANGHTEVVKELLKVKMELCSLRGKYGLSSLHCASVGGRVGAIVELLKASPSALFGVTVSGETSLHLAVKKNQLEAVKTLVDGIKTYNMFCVLSLRDEEGNTALHLAAARRNHLAIEVLLKCNASENGEVVQVNARNKNGLTALDLALICSSSSSCSLDDQYHSKSKTESLLLQAGARRADWVSKENQNHHVPQPNIWYAQNRNLVHHSHDSHDMLLLVLTLIALATYQAMLSPPCRIEDNGTQFIWFVLCNSTAFFISIATIWVMVRKSSWCLAIYVTTFALVSCYHSAVFRASPPGNLRNVAICICLALPFLPFLALQVKNLTLSRLRQK